MNLTDAKRTVATWMLPVLLVLPSSCTRVQVDVDAIKDTRLIPHGFPRGSSFCVVSQEGNESLQDREVSNKISFLLGRQEYATRTHGDCDYYLTYKYWMKHSKSIVHQAVAVPGETQTTTGNVRSRTGGVSYSESTQSSGTVAYVPKEVHWAHQGIQLRVFDAAIYREQKKEVVVWEGSANSTGQIPDLRYIMDFLLVPLFNHFGKNTGRTVLETVTDWNGEVKELKDILSSLSQESQPQEAVRAITPADEPMASEAHAAN